MNRYVQRAREMRDQGGFTLIELMIVIIILAVLAGIVLFAVGGLTNSGAAAACKTDLSTVTTGVEAYRAQAGAYPPDLKPSLTTQAPAANPPEYQFLHDQPTLAALTLTQNGGALSTNQNGYTITYTPSGANAGAVSATRSDGSGTTTITGCGS